MFAYHIRESVSVPRHFTISYRDEDTGQLIALLNSKATPLLFTSRAHAAAYVANYCAGYVTEGE